MSIADFPTPRTSNFKKTEFIRLSPGQHVVRFLQEKAVTHFTHYVRGMTYKCLNDGCPICDSNTRLQAENPKTRTDQLPGYTPRRAVAYINVLDRTPAKVCPNCSAEIKKVNGVFPPSCSACNASLTAIKSAPLNKVKVLSKGKLFFDQVEFHKATVVDEETETPINFTTYDFGVLVMGGKTTPAVNPMLERNDAVEVDPEDLFDLEKAIVVLTPEELLDAMRGVRLADIMRARKSETVAEEKPMLSEEMLEDMDKLFNS